MAKRNAICFDIMCPVIAAPKDVEGQRIDLRFLRPLRADLSIKKSSSFFPPLTAATSQLGFAPRPAQVSPEGLRYFGGTFLPLNALPPASNNPCAADYSNPLQLLLKLGPSLMEGFVNPLSQVHECFNGHS